MNDEDQQLDKLKRYSVNTSLFNLVLLMPIQFVLMAFRNQTTQLTSITVINLVIGPLASILFNVMIVRLHYPDKDQARM